MVSGYQLQLVVPLDMVWAEIILRRWLEVYLWYRNNSSRVIFGTLTERLKSKTFLKLEINMKKLLIGIVVAMTASVAVLPTVEASTNGLPRPLRILCRSG